MEQTTLYVGLDTDKKHIDIAVAEPLPGGEVRYVGKIANDAQSLQRSLKRLARGADGPCRRLVVCYEAGPCGYGIYRRLNAQAGMDCRVVAPSLIPRRPGDRVKTNRRDALSLARLLRADELTAVWVPDEAHEAMRDLVRARAVAVAELNRCRQHISSLLLRQGVGYAGKPWSKKHRTWLGRLDWEEPAHRLLFAELLTRALGQGNPRPHPGAARQSPHSCSVRGSPATYPWSGRYPTHALEMDQPSQPKPAPRPLHRPHPCQPSDAAATGDKSTRPLLTKMDIRG